MRNLYLGNGDKKFKFADTKTEIHLTAYDDGSAATLTSDAKVRIKNDSGYLLGVSASITDNHAVITSGQLAQLPSGSYLLELWDTVDGGTAIYPSDGFLALQINENVTGLSGGLVSSITVDEFIKQFSDLSQQLKQEVAVAVANGVKGDKGDDGLSAYQVAVINGYKGLQTEWLASLIGAKGDKGDPGNYVPETFTNLSAIQSKYPTGSNGIMVAADNGHKYIWANGTWTDAGIYQSVGIAENSLDFTKISFNASQLIGWDENAIDVSPTGIQTSATPITITFNYGCIWTLSGNMVSYLTSETVEKTIPDGYVLYLDVTKLVDSNHLTADSYIIAKPSDFPYRWSNILLALNFAGRLLSPVQALQNKLSRIYYDSKDSAIEMPAPYTSKDLNSLMTPSINFCANNNNQPAQIGKYEAYTLINYVNGSGISQTIISQKNVYLRNGSITNGTATFEEWHQLIPEIEVVKSITVDKSLVSPNGDTTFSSFVEAMKYAYSLNKKVDVHVKSGTYDMIQEFSDKYGSDYLNTTSTEVGCYIGNGMHIVFEPDAQIVCHYSGTNTQILSMFSPLTAKDSDYILENVKIDSKNVRYSVHDDPNGEYYEHRYINCEFNHDNSSNSVSTTAPFAIGGGLSKNCKIVILGGRYSTVAKTGIDTAPISYHNSVFDGAKSNIIIRNVYLDGALRFTWWGPSKKLTNVLVSGCSTTSGIITHVEAGGAGYDDNNNFKITSWNNEIRNQ